jgi:hypothetical protein
MKRIEREVDEKRGILQVTVTDERWYIKDGVPVPSVTWIAGFWPKGVGFYKWLADKGWDEAEAVKTAAGDKGSMVHKAIEMVLNGEELRIDTELPDLQRSTETNLVVRDLTYEELICTKSFIDWRDSVNLEVLSTEITVFSDKENYAGTVDLVCRIDGVPYVIDFKTSKQVWKEHELQISAYKHALLSGENTLEKDGKPIDLTGLKTAILQVGYDKNKAGFKFTEIDDQFDMFKVAQQIWQSEVGNNQPGFSKREFPVVLSEKITK